MAIIGNLLKRFVKVRKTIQDRLRKPSLEWQQKELRDMLTKARYTEFGRTYNFSQILKEPDLYKAFSERVHIYDYNSIFDNWWQKTVRGIPDVAWPGITPFFALTSGTSGSASKRVPITPDMMKAMKKGSVRQILSIADLNLPEEVYQKRVLLLGGSTKLMRNAYGLYEGDLSGILAKKQPKWFAQFSKPGPTIASMTDWDSKIDEMVKRAPEWDIGIMVGVPAWGQILLEKIIAYHKLKSIHDIWPNLSIYVHSGVAFGPYVEAFKKLMGKEIYYIESYLASEGLMAFQVQQERKTMQLFLDNGIFFEFVPFNEDNFTDEGNIKQTAKAICINDVEEGIDYALLITTCAGAWRYLIGDTVKFTSKEKFEIVITGRVKHFLSICGEHLSVDNMTQAITYVSSEMGIDIREFCVTGIPYNGMYAHKWYIGSDVALDKDRLIILLDNKLCEINDDYRTERGPAIKEVMVEILPLQKFYDFIAYRGRKTAQSKFPRVIKGDLQRQWEMFLNKS
ncbi:MAG: GH3 auxin-responsive promoter family protein [Flavobacteriales bacterium]